MLNNYERMMQIIDETFATRADQGQIQVNDDDIKKLKALHPSSLKELSNEDGPLVWVLIIPTTFKNAQLFLRGKITEKELFDMTLPGEHFDCLYLCSVTTLPEYRKKGLTFALCMEAVSEISREHDINCLIVWPLTRGGEALAEKVASECQLTLHKRQP